MTDHETPDTPPDATSAGHQQTGGNVRKKGGAPRGNTNAARHLAYSQKTARETRDKFKRAAEREGLAILESAGMGDDPMGRMVVRQLVRLETTARRIEAYLGRRGWHTKAGDPKAGVGLLVSTTDRLLGECRALVDRLSAIRPEGAAEFVVTIGVPGTAPPCESCGQRPVERVPLPRETGCGAGEPAREPETEPAPDEPAPDVASQSKVDEADVTPPPVQHRRRGSERPWNAPGDEPEPEPEPEPEEPTTNVVSRGGRVASSCGCGREDCTACYFRRHGDGWMN